MVKVFIDPAYFSTGLFILNEKTSKFSFDAVVCEGDSLKSYENYLHKADIVSNMVVKRIAHYNPIEVYVEIPPPIGHTSAGLYGLSFLLVTRLKSQGYRVFAIPTQLVYNFQKKYYQSKKHKDRLYIALDLFKQQRILNNGITFDGIMHLENNIDTATAYLFYVFSNERIKTDKKFKLKEI